MKVICPHKEIAWRPIATHPAPVGKAVWIRGPQMPPMLAVQGKPERDDGPMWKPVEDTYVPQWAASVTEWGEK